MVRYERQHAKCLVVALPSTERTCEGISQSSDSVNRTQLNERWWPETGSGPTRWSQMKRARFGPKATRLRKGQTWTRRVEYICLSISEDLTEETFRMGLRETLDDHTYFG